LRDYQPNYGTDGEESSEVEDPFKSLYTDEEYEVLYKGKKDDISKVDDNDLLNYDQTQMDDYVDKTRKMMGSN
jgi:hypothetical protein